MTSEPHQATKSTVAGLLAVDAVLIVIFAMIGISSHNGNLDPASIARVAIPFLIPYLILAAGIRPTRLIHNIFPMGVILWLSTVIIGPILRAALFNDTSALAFMLVTSGALALLLIGRRIISTLVTRGKQTT
ncbi:MAG TPA: DUF3054 family protein [Enteractinococcus helveticum]|uniref:DUF3054 family protein n=1 Tax=Enteractinococcus helveticum TaxID=1837282 RepID=A0A921FP35_9MICC|nr:DUF3054 domain-containing protein [Enteractinococcus helveticum]HJF14552.1 DUF3054 family protein [Enteractinococcus helveticum]